MNDKFIENSSVSDPHQDDADPDPRIRIGRFGPDPAI